MREKQIDNDNKETTTMSQQQWQPCPSNESDIFVGLNRKSLAFSLIFRFSTSAERCTMCSTCYWPPCAWPTPCSFSATLPSHLSPLDVWTSWLQVMERSWPSWWWCFAVLYTSLECGVYVSLASSIFITVSLTFERFQVTLQIFALDSFLWKLCELSFCILQLTWSPSGNTVCLSNQNMSPMVISGHLARWPMEVDGSCLVRQVPRLFLGPTSCNPSGFCRWYRSMLVKGY